MFCSYYFILQTKYSIPEQSVRSEDITNQSVVFVANEDNAYLEEQKDGSYLFHLYGMTVEIDASDVEAGLYDFYPIVEYQEDNKNVFVELFMKIQENIKNIFSD